MYDFVYTGESVDVDVNESISYKIEDDLMTLYEDGRLVDNIALEQGNYVHIRTSDEYDATIVVEAKVDDEKAIEILRQAGVKDDQIEQFTSDNGMNYKAFVKVLANARKESEKNETKDVLRDSLGLNDDQVEKLVTSDKSGFTALMNFLKKGKKMAEKSAEQEQPPETPEQPTDATAAPAPEDTGTQPSEEPAPETSEQAPVEPSEPAQEQPPVPEAAPTDQSGGDAGMDNPDSDMTSALINAGDGVNAEAQPEQPQDQAASSEPAPAQPEQPQAPDAQPQEQPSAPAPAPEGQAQPAQPEDDGPDFGEGELQPEEREESVAIEAFDDLVDAYMVQNNRDKDESPTLHDVTLSMHKKEVDRRAALDNLRNSMDEKKAALGDFSGLTKLHRVAPVLSVNNDPEPAFDIGDVKEDSSATVGAMLPQIGGNEFDMKDRAGQEPIRHIYKFRGTAIESYIDDIDMGYTEEVNESVKDIAKNIKTRTVLSLHIRKLAIDIAVLNTKLYIAKHYNKNKLKAINIERKMIKLQKELNDIKNAATLEEKEDIVKLQKEANAAAKKEFQEKLKHSAENKREENTLDKADKKVESIITKAKSKVQTHDQREDDKKVSESVNEVLTWAKKLDDAKAKFESTGEIRFKNMIRGSETFLESATKTLAETHANIGIPEDVMESVKDKIDMTLFESVVDKIKETRANFIKSCAKKFKKAPVSMVKNGSDEDKKKFKDMDLRVVSKLGNDGTLLISATTGKYYHQDNGKDFADWATAISVRDANKLMHDVNMRTIEQNMTMQAHTDAMNAAHQAHVNAVNSAAMSNQMMMGMPVGPVMASADDTTIEESESLLDYDTLFNAIMSDL